MILVLLSIFVVAFVLNLIWEELHQFFYTHYKGSKITHFILFRAALFDATFITLVFGGFYILDSLRHHLWIPILISLVFAILLEHWALRTNRWAYNTKMPIIPLIKSGLTPTIQLALLGTISYFAGKALL